MPLPIDTLLQGGKYKIVRHLSSGGFGVTYEAEHTLLHHRVAIKEFFVKDFCNRDEQTNRVTVATQGKAKLVERLKKKFEDEASAIFGLSHPNIVHVFDVFEENETAYYVMDFIDGLSLQQIVKQRGALPEAEAVGYIRQVAEALSYVHEQNRLHLDIKPGNIMVNEKGQAILIDFGTSKQYDEVDGENTSTLMGKTPGYAPLEQMGNSVQKFSPATDIYSLGATLYKLLAGTTPPDAIAMADAQAVLAPLPATISPAVRNAVAQAMQIFRANRPQTIAQFLQLLDTKENEKTLVEGDPIEVKPTPQPSMPKPQPSGLQPPKPKKIIWIAFAAIIVSLVILVIYKAGAGQVQNERDISREQMVDLGLSVKWAGYNVGASSPEEAGNYYAWGELSTKTEYSEDTYKYYSGGNYTDIGSDISGNITYDVARAEWGSSWRMPTAKEIDELLSRCTWTTTTYRGVKGCKVTGPNGNAIFLPAAGYRIDTSLADAGLGGDYWSSTRDSSSTNFAYYYFYYGSPSRVYAPRYLGYSVRPVSD